ncbi:hypothetical protein vseg_009158 [Gypsophila vaccaria]
MGDSSVDFLQFGLSSEETDKLVGEVVRYVLFKTQQSSGCPIKRDELTLIVTKNYRQRALPAAVIDKAKEKLAGVFGYELKELQRVRSTSKNQTRYSQQSAADARSYIVVSQLPADVYRKLVEDVNTAHLTGFSFVVVGIVHLAGGKISEENLWQHLRRLGLEQNDENHPTLGNVKLLLETLVQQRYLQKEKVSGAEGNTVMYELAERALDDEVNQKIKDYVSQIISTDVGIEQNN